MQDFNAKLSDFGLAKTGPTGDQTHVVTAVMGTEGYADPEYIRTGIKSTVLSFYRRLWSQRQLKVSVSILIFYPNSANI